MLIFLAGCQGNLATENSTTKTQNLSTEYVITTSETQNFQNEETTIVLNETKENTYSPTEKSEFFERYDDAPAADTLQFDIKTLKELKKAAATMTDAEFENYLEENRFIFAWLEMVNTVEKFNSLIYDIENIYVAVLDTDSYDDVSLTYYTREKRIFQAVSFSETKRFAFDYYVGIDPIYYFKDLEGAEYVKTIEINSVNANVYELESRKGFCADAVLGEQEFDIRVSEKQTIEEFEADFARLEFVKIGDLLNESYVESTQTETETTE